MFACDASQRAEVDKLFAELDAALGAPDVVVYNASYRTRGPFVELDPADVEKAIAVTAFGASWWRSRRRGGCCRRSTARSCSPARRRA